MKFPCAAAVLRSTVHPLCACAGIGVGACGDFVQPNASYASRLSESVLYISFRCFFVALLHMPTALEYLLLLDNDLFSFRSFQRQRMRLPHRYWTKRLFLFGDKTKFKRWKKKKLFPSPRILIYFQKFRAHCLRSSLTKCVGKEKCSMSTWLKYVHTLRRLPRMPWKTKQKAEKIN